MKNRSLKQKILLALFLFLVGNGIVRFLALQNGACYMALFLTYGVCGAVLCPPLEREGPRGRLFWALAAVGLLALMLLPLLPFHTIPYGARVFLTYSHIEIFPAFLLGMCLAALTQRTVRH